MFNSLKHIASTACVTAVLSVGSAVPANAGLDAYLGEIMLVPFTFCPRGTAEANGAILPISQFSALFSLIGTTYGGDGRSTFGLPDLRSRVPVGFGQGPGLSDYPLGAKRGSERTPVSMPAHTHDTVVKPMASNKQASRQDPTGAFLGNPVNENIYFGDEDQIVEMNVDSIVVTESSRGTTAPDEHNVQPVLALRFCMSTTGSFPSRP
jgi:microcystin-dependent protein